MAKIAVLGDLSGWINPLYDCLTDLGVKFSEDPDTWIEHWPEDLHVVQVGDLIHKGPDSEAIVSLVDSLLRDESVNWTQLFGNHESQYLPIAAPVFWDKLIDVDAYKTLLSWYHDSLIHPSCAITTKDGHEYLVTHAGLAFMLWAEDFAGMSPPIIARRLNSAPDSTLVVAPGMMLGGGMAEHRPGVIWTEGAYELRLGWQVFSDNKGQELPFDQIHGHTRGLTFDRFRKEWIVPRMLEKTTIIDENNHTITTIPQGGQIIGIDPNSTARRMNPLIPYIVEDGIINI